ncbi:hypothetical protein D3C78_1088230 [compost metagenome]
MIGTIGGEAGGTGVVRAVGSQFACANVIGTIGSEAGGAGVVGTVGSDSGFTGVNGRAGAVVTIGGEGVGCQDGEGQGEDQLGFHGCCSRFVGVVCLGLQLILRLLFRLKSANKCLK